MIETTGKKRFNFQNVSILFLKFVGKEIFFFFFKSNSDSLSYVELKLKQQSIAIYVVPSVFGSSLSPSDVAEDSAKFPTQTIQQSMPTSLFVLFT